MVESPKSSDVGISLRLQAYALLIQSGQLPKSVQNKIIGQIAKDIGLPITLEELQEQDPQPVRAVQGPRTSPFFCPLCHSILKMEMPWVTTMEEHAALMKEQTQLIASHLSACVIVQAIAKEILRLTLEHLPESVLKP